MDLKALWCEHVDFTWWQMLLIGVFFLLMNFCVFVAMWYARKSLAIEFGFPKRNKKAKKIKKHQYSFLNDLFLIRVTKEAERKGFFLYLNLFCHFTNFVGYIACIIGFIGSILTLADGWALTLLIASELLVLFLCTIIEFLPHLIWIPSERKRYRL